MSSYFLGAPDESSFEAGNAPYLESVKTVFDTNHSDMQNIHYGIVEIVLIEKGICSLVTQDNHVHALRKGSLVIIGGGIFHDFRDGENLQALALHIGDVRLRGLPAAQISNESAPISIALSAAASKGILLALLQSIKLLAMEQDPGHRPEVGASLARALIVMLLTLLEERAHRSAEKSLQGIGVRIKEYIDAHYLEDLKLPEIAAALHINPYYLSHTFKDLTGSSPMSYIIRRRIDEAQSLLLTTNLTITAIAMECGYNNSNYFQSVFKNIVGMTPGKYRKMWKQDL